MPLTSPSAALPPSPRLDSQPIPDRSVIEAAWMRKGRTRKIAGGIQLALDGKWTKDDDEDEPLRMGIVVKGAAL
jgi:hypothetical protein